MSVWSTIFTKRAEDWVYAPLHPSQCPPDGSRRSIMPNADYICVSLQSMHLVNVRTGLKYFYGVVNSYAKVSHLSGNPAEFNIVITPENLKNVDSAHLDRVISLEQPILGPVPYRGELELETGLFSVEARDLAGDFLNLLNVASNLAGIAYISSAIPYVDLIKKGLDMIVPGNDSSVLEIGFSRKFTNLETGYFIVMRANKNEINVNELCIDHNDYRLLNKDNIGVLNYPYMVFRITASQRRNDWFQIPEISNAYNTLMAAVKMNSYSSADESLKFFRRIVKVSPDLIQKDADKVDSEVSRLVSKAMGATRTAGGEIKSLPELKDIKIYD